ncbi:MAG: CHAD domain-containing protein [Cyclobacteriaceae bacterium]
MSFRIDLQETLAMNAERIMQGRLDKCREKLQNENPHEAIHDARKQMKKIRAFARLYRGEIGEKKYQKTNAYYRDIARQMSEARDTAALLTTLDKLYGSLDKDLCAKVFDDIKNHLASRKSAVSRIAINRDHLLEKVDADLASGEDIHRKWKIKNNDFSALSPGIEKTYERCQQAMKKAYKKNSVKAFHEWRKRAKYLRYEVDYLRNVWPQPMKALEKELHQLTDYLGDDHDLAVLKEYIKKMEHDESDARTAILSLIEKKQQVLREKALPLGKAILYESPDDFSSRLAFYWKKQLKTYKLEEKQTPLSVS